MQKTPILNGALVVLGTVFLVVGLVSVPADALVGYLGTIGGLLLVAGGLVALLRGRKPSRRK